MPLEATMMLIDNSEYMRNGDYQPTRFEAQADAVNVVFQTKVDSNPENTVGVMSMANKGPEVLVTHSKDLGQILQAVHTTASKIDGQIDIPTAIAIAQLALKHRTNKNLRQRIIVFVGSPLEGPAVDEKSMIKLAKKLKKNNIAVDIVCFGDGIEETTEDGRSVLKSFVDAATSGDNSHLLVIPPGSHLLSDALISSPILSGDRAGAIPEELGGTGEAGASTSGAGNQFEFGVDPSLDPELAMALRMSMEEAQAREAAERASAPQNPAPTTSTSAPAAPTDDEEKALLEQAMAMSRGQDVDMDGGAGSAGADDEEDDEMEDDDEEDEDAAIARAIAMSMKQDEEEDASKKK